MYKTAITLPVKIRSKSVAALLAGLVAVTALSMPLTASAGTPLPQSNAYQLRLDAASRAAIRTQVDRDFRAVAMQQLWRSPQGICVGDSEHQC
jgi:hypothetical protein